MRKTTASIVLYNNPPEELLRVLECVSREGIERLWLVDNSQSDALRHVADGLERVEYIFPGKNLGYGGGHNVAMRRSLEMGADYHVVINPDITWKGDVLGTLGEYMDSHPDVGQVMPMVRYPDGRPQRLCKLLPSPLPLFGRRFIPLRKLRQFIVSRYELQCFPLDREADIPSLSGCFMFMRVDTLRRVGLFDERYFMYLEDFDLCRRIGDVSRTVFYPGVEIEHAYHAGSYHDRRLLRIHIRSLISYFNKWGWVFDRERRRRNRACLKQFEK